VNEQEKILIVDDEPSSLDLLWNLLKPHYRLAVARDGETALRLAAGECPPSLILLDVVMPGMDGYETCRRLKADPATRPIPVIFLTVRGEVEAETQGLELGAVDYLAKPVNPPILLARAETHITLYKIQQDLEAQVRARTAELMEREQQLIRAKERAEAGERAKSAFLSVMSHEMRTPLNAILGMNQLLETGTQPSEEQRQLLDAQRHAVRGLTTLVEDVLTISDLDSREPAPPGRGFDLNLMLDSLQDVLGHAAREKGLILSLHRDHAVSIRRIGDVSRLRQLLLVLLGNALKFTDRGEIGLRISEPDPGRLRFEVNDTGIGIAAEHQRMIFEPFSQVDSSPTRRHGGGGLGLSIALRLAESMKGEISLESVPGVGSTFTFIAPLPVATPP